MLRLRIVSMDVVSMDVLSMGAAFIAGAFSLAACSGAKNGQAPAESAGSPEAPTAGETASAGGGSATPVAGPHGKRAPCSSDQSCNEDPSVSALWGRCTELGVCECSPGFERSPSSDLCRPQGLE